MHLFLGPSSSPCSRMSWTARFALAAGPANKLGLVCHSLPLPLPLHTPCWSGLNHKLLAIYPIALQTRCSSCHVSCPIYPFFFPARPSFHKYQVAWFDSRHGSAPLNCTLNPASSCCLVRPIAAVSITTSLSCPLNGRRSHHARLHLPSWPLKELSPIRKTLSIHPSFKTRLCIGFVA